tara:strand:+ start:1215 stop:1913 length:699 start_codon:yes stop_codon:yes gene_type:complete
VLIIFQSIAGVGVLVIGTPVLLILGFEFLDVISILLPISILTSLINLFFIRFSKIKQSFNIDNDYNRLFYFICLPSIFIGIIILKYFGENFNFNYIVSFVILISVLLSRLKKFVKKINRNSKITVLLVTGIIHGISNSGGSLLSLFISSNLNKDLSRYNITYFYFFLAFFQYIVFLFFFEKFFLEFNFIILFTVLVFGIIVGNYMSKFFGDKTFRNLISILSIMACCVLIIK